MTTPTTTSQQHLLMSEPAAARWHAESAAEVVRALAADATRGLSGAEAASRLNRHGPNRIAEAEAEPWWEELLESLREPLQLLLVAVGVVYAVLGELEDALTILAVIVTVAAVETLSEARAKRAIAALRTLGAPTATVVRESTPLEIATADLVPGDLVILEAGDRVPADVRLVEAVALRVDESSLTGESVPVAKDADTQVAADAELGDRRTVVFAGTNVTSGKGRGLVVATGRTAMKEEATALQGRHSSPHRTLCITVCDSSCQHGVSREQALIGFRGLMLQPCPRSVTHFSGH